MATASLPPPISSAPASLPANDNSLAPTDAPKVVRGSKLPKMNVKLDGMIINSEEYFSTRRGIVFGAPGAFIPWQHQEFVKAFATNHGSLHKYVDFIGCVVVNDPYVLRAWARAAGYDHSITFLSDPLGAIARDLGMLKNYNRLALGYRCCPFVIIIGEGGYVQWVSVDSAEVTFDRTFTELVSLYGNDPEPSRWRSLRMAEKFPFQSNSGQPQSNTKKASLFDPNTKQLPDENASDF